MHLKQAALRHEAFPDLDVYPFNLQVLRKTKILRFDKPITFFTGENGAGKSTLLKAVCRRCGIHIWEGPTRVRFQENPYENALSLALEVTWAQGPVTGTFFGSQIFNNFAGLVDEWAVSSPDILKYYGGKSLMTQSHGQSLMSFFGALVRRPGLYFLDEPETALSPKSQVALLELLTETASLGSVQCIIATHSPILMACPGSEILSFDQAPVAPVAYRDTTHFKVYHDFMSAQG